MMSQMHSTCGRNDNPRSKWITKTKRRMFTAVCAPSLPGGCLFWCFNWICFLLASNVMKKKRTELWSNVLASYVGNDTVACYVLCCKSTRHSEHMDISLHNHKLHMQFLHLYCRWGASKLGGRGGCETCEKIHGFLQYEWKWAKNRAMLKSVEIWHSV